MVTDNSVTEAAPSPAPTPGRPRLPLLTKKGAIRLAVLFVLLAGLLLCAWSCMIRMPGESFHGPLPPLTSEQTALAARLRSHVEELAGRIGIRNAVAYSQLEEAANYVEGRLKETGLPVARQTFTPEHRPFHNIEAELRGRAHPEEIVVIGGHYDSVIGCPGANDNGTGAAATIALASAFATERLDRTIRFVAFTNEEPPHFKKADMGSLVYARRCRERGENVVVMISLETMGYYSDRPGSQSYPSGLGLLYPKTGNFVAFVGDVSSREFVREALGTFRSKAQFPSEGGALIGWLRGVGWSDHWSFWQAGYPAIMVSDTAVFRYPEYHTSSDTPDKIDFDRFARVVDGLVPVIRELASVKK